VRRVRAAIWSLSIGALAVLLGATLVRSFGLPPVPVLLLSIALVCGAASLIVELAPAQGAAAGVCALVIVIAVLVATDRPDLRGLTAFAYLEVVLAAALCALFGWAPIRLLRRKR
jgi:hypothetical protein